MSGIDWHKAPAWATVLLKHLYCTSTVWAASYADGAKAESVCQQGIQFELVSRAWSVVAKRPSPAWSGEGLPPVGTVCQVFNSDLSGAAWEKCTILFIGKHRVVYDSESCCERIGYIDCLQFLPIRTPEQIAADEREAAIDEIMRAYEYKEGSCTHTLLRSQAARFYDAGLYRKLDGKDG